MIFDIACPGGRREICKFIPSLLESFDLCMMISIQVKLVRLSKSEYFYQYFFQLKSFNI